MDNESIPESHDPEKIKTKLLFQTELSTSRKYHRHERTT